MKIDQDKQNYRYYRYVSVIVAGVLMVGAAFLVSASLASITYKVIGEAMPETGRTLSAITVFFCFFIPIMVESAKKPRQ